MMKWFSKALSAMRHAGRLPFFLGHLARTRFDFKKEVGDGIDASVVMAPVQFIQRSFPEAPLKVFRLRPERVEAEGHPLTNLVARPNGSYSDIALWSATLLSYLVDGNAYWMKVRNGLGRPVELWYVPHWTLEPKWPADGSAFISHYEYTPGGGARPEDINPSDIVHFRHGVDPRNLRKGLSPLHGAIREIFMDLESSNFVASLLRNMGVPGLVVSPDGAAQAGPDDVEAVKKWLQQSFGGDRRGQPLVMGAPTKVSQFGFDPKAMDLSVSRDVAEERVCASLGIPAAIVGFGAGLQQTKVGATMEELRRLAWTNGIIPVQRALADELGRSLLPDFEKDPAGFELMFDSSAVVALTEDLVKKVTAWDTMVRGGWAEVAEAREAVGLDVDETHRIYLRPVSMFEVPAGQAPIDRTAEPEQAAAAAEESKRIKAARRTLAQARYVAALERMERGLAQAMQRRLKPVFEALGEAAADAARPLVEEDLAQRGPTGEAAAQAGEAKASPEDEILAGRILEQLELPFHETAFRRVYEAHYLQVAERVAEAGELLGLAADLPDPVARAVVAAGGRRAGLVDLNLQSRQALFDSLAEGRAAGEGVDALVTRIRDGVASGPWTNSETRARTIARTETKYAQNVSTMARARHEGVQRFIVFDGRLGPGRSTPSHIARDGSIVSADEAEVMAAEEHPNGTLSFAPYIEEE